MNDTQQKLLKQFAEQNKGWPKEQLDLALWRVRWELTALPHQREPEDGEYDTFLLLAGRGSGKTHTASNWLGLRAAIFDKTRWLVTAPTSNDIRATCFEGDSGLLNIIPSSLIKDYNKSLHELLLVNGSLIKGIPASEPERFRGAQFHGGWCDELAAWDYLQDAWDQIQFGMRPCDEVVTASCMQLPHDGRASHAAMPGNKNPGFTVHRSASARRAGLGHPHQPLVEQVVDASATQCCGCQQRGIAVKGDGHGGRRQHHEPQQRRDGRAAQQAAEAQTFCLQLALQRARMQRQRSGGRGEPPYVIHCCGDNSRYDPSAGARVVDEGAEFIYDIRDSLIEFARQERGIDVGFWRAPDTEPRPWKPWDTDLDMQLGKAQVKYMAEALRAIDVFGAGRSCLITSCRRGSA